MFESNESGDTFFRSYSGQLLTTTSLGWLLISLGRRILPPLLPSIIDELAITPFKAGLALTITSGLYAFATYPGGQIADQLSRKTALVGGLGSLAFGFVVLSQTRTYWMFIVGTALVGTGAGLYFIPMRTAVANLFIENRGQAFGITSAAGTGGSILAAGFATVALSVVGWRGAFLPIVGALVVVILLFHFWNKEPYSVSRVDFDPRASLKRVFSEPALRLLLLAYAFEAFAWSGMLNFLPTFLQADKGFTTTLANASFASVFIIGIIVGPTTGYLSDRYSRIPITLAGLLVAGTGLSGVVVSERTPFLLGAILVFAAGLMTFPTVMQAHLLDILPDDRQDTDFGVFKTIYTGVASFGPVYVGFVAKRGDYTSAFVGLGILLSLSAGLLAWLLWYE